MRGNGKSIGPRFWFWIVLQSFLLVPRATSSFQAVFALQWLLPFRLCSPNEPPGPPTVTFSRPCFAWQWQKHWAPVLVLPQAFPEQFLPFRLCSPSNDPPGPPRVTFSRHSFAWQWQKHWAPVLVLDRLAVFSSGSESNFFLSGCLRPPMASSFQAVFAQ